MKNGNQVYSPNSNWSIAESQKVSSKVGKQLSVKLSEEREKVFFPTSLEG